MNAESIKIESDERGFELHILVDEDPVLSDSGWMVLNVHAIADELYDAVRSEIGPWLQEREDARRTLPVAAMDVSDGYDLTDPKHPDWHSVHADLYDSREGK